MNGELTVGITCECGKTFDYSYIDEHKNKDHRIECPKCHKKIQFIFYWNYNKEEAYPEVHVYRKDQVDELKKLRDDIEKKKTIKHGNDQSLI